MGRRLLILGPPGAGKGTQAAMIAATVGIPHVSTGEMLRDHVARGTDLGARAKVIMEAGDLVPDEIVIAMVKERLAAPDAACGFLLDGFPRTAPQAEALERESIPIEAVVNLEVDEDELVTRMLARGRADDTEETVRNRFAVYRRQTEPLIAHYESRGLIRTVDGMGTIDEVFARICRTLAG
jgi:adenylate kinase